VPFIHKGYRPEQAKERIGGKKPNQVHMKQTRLTALLAAQNNTVKALKALENGPEMEVVKK